MLAGSIGTQGKKGIGGIRGHLGVPRGLGCWGHYGCQRV